MRNLIGREKEHKRFMRHYISNKAEFIALFGRRRVGKTFLVKSLFESEFSFYATGMQNGDTQTQINNFNNEIINFGGEKLKEASNWSEAFNNLHHLIENKLTKGKKVIFLDEISWMGMSNSDFISALDFFWNRWISSRDDVLLIVCGSATSWIMDNIVNDTGGLHNRLTDHIQLEPFSLSECEEFLRDKGVSMPRYQILEFYMIFGGIPYYLDFIEADRSLAQNIDRMYFEKGAPLKKEYDNLFRALFKNADNYIKIIEVLASKRTGMSRKDMTVALKQKSGGTFSKILSDLISCGFVEEYLAFGKQKRDCLYRLVDPFTFFHLTFSDKQKRFTENYWLHYSITPAHSAWSGYAFELACLLHLPQIKSSLGISGVLTQASSWRSISSSPGVQIDLVLERSDKVVHLCEMKFTSTEYTIAKSYGDELRRKKAIFLTETNTKKAVHTTLVTTYGLMNNEYSSEVLFQLTMNDLYR